MQVLRVEGGLVVVAVVAGAVVAMEGAHRRGAIVERVPIAAIASQGSNPAGGSTNGPRGHSP